MEGYKPPKVFSGLAEKIDDKVASGEWKKLKKGKTPRSETRASSPSPENGSSEQAEANDTSEHSSVSPAREKNIPVQRGNVFKNPDGARMVVERVASDGDVPMVYATEYGRAPGKEILQQKRILGRPLHNFQVHAGMKEMEAVDPIQDREPVFYEAYEQQMKVLGNAFSREFFACEKALDTWEAELASGSDIEKNFFPLERIRLLRQRMDEIADEWESIDNRLVSGGRRQASLLNEIRYFSRKELDPDEDLLKWRQDALEALKSEYGDMEPDALLIERGYFRDVLHGKVERLLGKCRQVKSGKLRISDEVSSLPEFEREIRRLSESIAGYESQNVDLESTAVEIKDVLDALDEMNRVAFQSDANENGKTRVHSKEKAAQNRKKMKNEKNGDGDKRKTGSPVKKGRARGNPVVNVGAGDVQAPVAEDIITAEEAPTEQLASYRQFLEEEQRGRTALIDLTDHATIETVFSYEIDPATGKETKKKIFLPVPDDARQIADSMSKASQREARMLWAEMNSDLEALYLGRKFILTLESVRKAWQEKITQAESVATLKTIGRNGKKAREFISVDPKDDAEEFQPIRDVLRQMIDQHNRLPKDTDRPGFSKLFDGQLKAPIVAANKELSSLWQNRFQELGGRVYDGDGERVTSTEMVDLKALRQEAEGSIEAFLEKSLRLIDERLAAKGENFLDIYRKDRDRAKKILATVGGHIVSIAAAYAGKVGQNDADALRQAVVKFGTDRLAISLKQKAAGLLESRVES